MRRNKQRGPQARNCLRRAGSVAGSVAARTLSRRHSARAAGVLGEGRRQRALGCSFKLPWPLSPRACPRPAVPREPRAGSSRTEVESRCCPEIAPGLTLVGLLFFRQDSGPPSQTAQGCEWAKVSFGASSALRAVPVPHLLTPPSRTPHTSLAGGPYESSFSERTRCLCNCGFPHIRAQIADAWGR